MWLEIHQFRNLVDRKVEFKAGLNLIHGSNGKGKSNTLAAIEWVLYGVGKALPRKKKKAYVSLKIKDLVIERKKGPDFFKVTRSRIKDDNGVDKLVHKEYIDRDAEEIIKSYFGSYEIWKAVCYIPQESRCRLFSGTKEQQVQTLNQIIFADANPVDMQKKIESKRKEEEQELREMKAKMEGLSFGYTSEDVNDDKPNEGLHSAQIEAMLALFSSQKSQLETYEKNRKEGEFKRTILVKEKEKIVTSIDKLEKDMEVLGSTVVLIGNVDALNNERDNLTQQLKKYRQLHPLITKLNELTAKGDIDPTNFQFIEEVTQWFTHYIHNQPKEYKNIEEVLQRENVRFTLFKTKCESVGIEYTTESITERKLHNQDLIKSCIALESYFRAQDELNKLKQQLDVYIPYKENKESELEAKTKQCIEFQQNMDILQCPSCEQSLVYASGQLCVKEGTSLHLSESEKKKEEMKLIEEKNKLIAYQKLHLVFNLLSKEYNDKLLAHKAQEINVTKAENELTKTKLLKETNQEVNVTKAENEVTKTKLLKENTELESIVVINKPPSYSEYVVCKKNVDRHNEITLIKEQLSKEHIGELRLEKINDTVNDMEENVKRLNDKIQNIRLSIQTISCLTKNKFNVCQQLKEVEEQLACMEPLPSKEDELANCNATIDNIQVILRTTIEEEKMYEKKQKIVSLHKDTVGKTKRVNDIVTIKDICKTVQSERIDESLYTINKVANEILKDIFNEPLSIEINATKETKQGKVKNELALNIEHNGDTLSSLDELNVGHSARISMAISLALFQINQCPFLLMDEIFSPVDGEAIDISLNTMKNNLPKGRFCIITGLHYNGMYNNVVEL